MIGQNQTELRKQRNRQVLQGRILDTFEPVLRKTYDGTDLSEQEAYVLASAIMEGMLSSNQIAGILIALRVKGETVEELTGFVRALRDHMTPCPIRSRNAIDTCGTGGDGRHTFNISTCAGLLSAAVGAVVAKHGNRSVSSACGSADILERLGFRIDASPSDTARMIEKHGFGFLFAPVYHPAMKHALAPRRELGVRTIFNLVGPLSNPASVRRQVTGVFSSKWLVPFAEVLRRVGAEHCLIVHGADGIDEISVSGPTRIVELKFGEIREYTIRPEDYGISSAPIYSIQCQTPEESLEMIMEVFKGKRGPHRDAVLLNAGAALYVAGCAETFQEGVQLAESGIDSGAVIHFLQKLQEEASP